MKEVEDPREIESIARGIGAEARIEIIRFLQKEKKPKTLTEIYNHLKKNWAFITLQNHCRILAEEGIVEMKKEGGRYVVRLKKVPHVYIEEVG